jgi:hypothetical protein
MRTRQVEEGDVVARKPGQMMIVEDEDMVEHLAPESVPANLSAIAFMSGAQTAVLMTRMAAPIRCTVEGPTELGVAIPDQELRRAAVRGGVAGLLSGPLLGRFARSGDVDDAAGSAGGRRRRGIPGGRGGQVAGCSFPFGTRGMVSIFAGDAEE